MYHEYQENISPDREESFPLFWIVSENLLHLSTWTIAGLLIGPLRFRGWPIATLLWVIIVVSIQILLKKHNCSGCYYYGKFCHLGWGRLAQCLFRPDSGNMHTGMNLSLFYILSPPTILFIALLIGIFLQVRVWHWLFLGAYLALNLIAFPVRKKGCQLCAIRERCPGSASNTSKREL